MSAKDVEIAELRAEVERLTGLLQTDAWLCQSLLQLLHEHNVKPSSADLIAAVGRYADRTEAAEARVKVLTAALQAAERHLEEDVKNPVTHPIHFCPVLDAVRRALSGED